MDWQKANPMFLQPPVAEYRQSDYVVPALYDTGLKEKLQNLAASSFFKKVTAVNQAGTIGRKYENFSAVPYWDVNRYSIGYGTEVKKGDRKITEQEALNRMQVDLEARHKRLLSQYSGYSASNPNVQGAVLDLDYNVGDLSRFKYMPKFLAKPETMPYAIQEIPTFRRADGEVLRGLEKRRADEVRLAVDPNDKEYLPVYRESK